MGRRIMGRKVLWVFMTILALRVAAYAVAIVFASPVRPPLVRELLSDWPVASRAHFLGSAVALILGAVQVNTRLCTRYLNAHRWTGPRSNASQVLQLHRSIESLAGPPSRPSCPD